VGGKHRRWEQGDGGGGGKRPRIPGKQLQIVEAHNVHRPATQKALLAYVYSHL